MTLGLQRMDYKWHKAFILISAYIQDSGHRAHIWLELKFDTRHVIWHWAVTISHLSDTLTYIFMHWYLRPLCTFMNKTQLNHAIISMLFHIITRIYIVYDLVELFFFTTARFTMCPTVNIRIVAIYPGL